MLIKHVELKGKETDIRIGSGKIREIAKRIKGDADRIIDAKGMAIIPSFFNTHTHAAMSLLRGVADDLHLNEWLNDHIWPLESKMTKAMMHAGARLSVLEMIKSGTTFFNDMYWYPETALDAAEEMGIRAAVGLTLLDSAGAAGSKETVKRNFRRLCGRSTDMIRLTVAPHAIYTVSVENLLWAKEFARENGMMIHMHLSETEEEVRTCVEKTGKRPVQYLEDIGFLGEDLLTAHNVWLTAKEIAILKKHRVRLNHNPVSNMKLSVGRAFDWKRTREMGVSLGTDGASSNNNLDMVEEMKFAALLQKHAWNDPTLLPAREAFDMASLNGARAFGIDAGRIEVGKAADVALIDLRNPCLSPGRNMISDLVYAANGNAVDTLICNGKVVMRERKVPHEEEILMKAREAAAELMKGRMHAAKTGS